MTRPSAARRGYGRTWRKLSRAVIAAWVGTHGFYCPGYGVAPHYSFDLTADHRVPLAVGGPRLTLAIDVLCRRCNSRKGAQVASPTSLDTRHGGRGSSWRSR